jgi:nitrogen-specific signal transduction histidine kinase
VPNSTQSLLAGLFSTTVIVTAALGWSGWRLLDQQHLLDEQRTAVQIESTADVLAAGIRGKLAEAGERLSGCVSSPSPTLPTIQGAVVIAVRRDDVQVSPRGGLPFVPVDLDAPAEDPFAAPEAMEFSGAPARAMTVYRALADQDDPHTQAGALLRLGRVQRKSGDLRQALVTYERLTTLGPVRTGHLPAELAGLTGQRSTFAAMGDGHRADAIAERIRRGLDAGRWLIPRGVAELYRESSTEPLPQSWNLARALSDVWHETDGRLPARGYRVFTSAPAADSGVLVVWRSNGIVTAAMAASADAFLDLPKKTGEAWQLLDPEGKVISGRGGVAPLRSVARIIGEYPWTLHTWSESAEAPATSNARTILVAMMGATLAFVWGASYFMARAIRREAAVARLRSDFVAAVSHEFRSPLTAIRQMAEMLQGHRVPSDERRHTYYGMLAGEAGRLQRLVETLLNFGRIEAGAERYRFTDLDAAALVREVVDDVGPQAREMGKTIEVEGPSADIRVRADHAALSVALRNLIDNAIKYSPGEPTIWVRWQRDREGAAISVIDRGVGIPRSEQRTIFGKFVRGRDAIEANIKGTGVGLAIVQQIVTAHGGEIRLDSEPGRGSAFTLLLPATD